MLRRPKQTHLLCCIYPEVTLQCSHSDCKQALTLLYLCFPHFDIVTRCRCSKIKSSLNKCVTGNNHLVVNSVSIVEKQNDADLGLGKPERNFTYTCFDRCMNTAKQVTNYESFISGRSNVKLIVKT